MRTGLNGDRDVTRPAGVGVISNAELPGKRAGSWIRRRAVSQSPSPPEVNLLIYIPAHWSVDFSSRGRDGNGKWNRPEPSHGLAELRKERRPDEPVIRVYAIFGRLFEKIWSLG